MLCYEQLVARVRKLAVPGHVNLVETLAGRVASLCLEEPEVAAAKVRVEKLDVFADAASVGLAKKVTGRRRTFNRSAFRREAARSVRDGPPLFRDAVPEAPAVRAKSTRLRRPALSGFSARRARRDSTRRTFPRYWLPVRQVWTPRHLHPKRAACAGGRRLNGETAPGAGLLRQRDRRLRQVNQLKNTRVVRTVPGLRLRTCRRNPRFRAETLAQSSCFGKRSWRLRVPRRVLKTRRPRGPCGLSAVGRSGPRRSGGGADKNGAAQMARQTAADAEYSACRRRSAATCSKYWDAIPRRT